ncbi:MAG: hypothetical protein ABII06_17650 [Pseudomonadota bacterium]
MEALTKIMGLHKFIIRFIGNRFIKDKESERTQFSKQMNRQWFLGMSARDRGGTNRQIMRMLDL